MSELPVEQRHRNAAEIAFDEVLGDAGSYAEYLCSSYREGGVRTLSDAFARFERDNNLVPAPQWQPIETAQNFTRIMVCGWSPCDGNIAGHWWWQEDIAYRGEAVEKPHALYWCPILLPTFPPSPPNMEASHDD